MSLEAKGSRSKNCMSRKVTPKQFLPFHTKFVIVGSSAEAVAFPTTRRSCLLLFGNALMAFICRACAGTFFIVFAFYYKSKSGDSTRKEVGRLPLAS